MHIYTNIPSDKEKNTYGEEKEGKKSRLINIKTSFSCQMTLCQVLFITH